MTCIQSNEEVAYFRLGEGSVAVAARSSYGAKAQDCGSEVDCSAGAVMIDRQIGDGTSRYIS